MKLRGTIAGLAVACWVSVAGAQPAQQDRPLEVRVTGTFLPVTAESREDLVTVKVFVQGQPWLLRVGAVEKLTATERERAVDEGVLMRQVRFYGPDELIARLRQPEMAGRVLTIERQFDTIQKRFLVTAVKEAPEGAPQQPQNP